MPICFSPQRPTAGKIEVFPSRVNTHTRNFRHRAVYLYTIEGKKSRRRALGSSAFHLTVVKFLCDLPLVPCRAMAVGVELDLSLGSPLPSCVTRVLEQVVVVVLVVVRFLKRSQSLQIRCHFDSYKIHTCCCSQHVESRSE